MIPLWDNVPRRNFPFVVLSLILLNCLVFVRELSLSAVASQRLMQSYALIPAHTAGFLAGEPIHLKLAILPLFTSMFLHGGWMHLIGNMWFLWLFGDNVEDRTGHLRFLLLYFVGGLAGGLAQVYTSPESTVPTLGASGAIAAVMGAYLITFPRARIYTLVPIIIYLARFELPAYFILIYWMLLQTLNGVASLGVADSSMQGGVAWMAHVGGFLFGIPLMLLLRSRGVSRRRYA
jgi:membrane associated rhomboid family serine protease